MPERKGRGREPSPRRKRPHENGSRSASLLQLTLFDQLDPPPPAPAPFPSHPGPASRDGPARKRWSSIGGQAVAWQLRRARRRTIGFSIDNDGLRISAPRWVTISEIERAIASKSAWILRKLDEWRAWVERRANVVPVWRDGAGIDLLGRRLTLRLTGGSGEITVSDDLLVIGIPPQADPEWLREHVEDWLRVQAREVFGQRLPMFAQRLGRAPDRWALTSARTRWGSCTADGTIRLNWRLVHFHPDVIDYVIAHELAHLCEMNHGPRFWALVGRLYPGYEQARECLRTFPGEPVGI
jgi:predicted metal-dependent hydrolase